MRLEDAIRLFHETAQKMDQHYNRVVFDEWVVVSLRNRHVRVLSYTGPRAKTFQARFPDDLQPLRPELFAGNHEPGDYEFARHATGTCVDAFVVAGEGVYLFCNNTLSSIEHITVNPLWLSAQVHFVEMADKLRADPVILVPEPDQVTNPR